MTRKAEQMLGDLFADGQPHRFGTGWISGTLGVALGLLSVAAVLCLHFPQWLTVPELRGRYPLPLVRQAIDLAILATFLLAGLSLLLRRRKPLALTALALGGLALALGAGGVPIERGSDGQVYLGLDWFVLGTLSTVAVFVPLERWRPLRADQGTFRPGWLTDAEYFFASHALVQLMSVLVVLPMTALGSWLSVPGLARVVQATPLVAQALACLVVADLAQYWVHRAFHRVPLLWRFHLVHHSVESMDWLAGSRLHLIDIIATRGLVLLPLIAIGFDQRVVLGYLAFVSLHAVFIHANFAVRWAWLENWLVMPRFHHWHHAVEPAAHEANFAVHLPLLDRLFGTLHLPDDRWPERYGVAGVAAPEGWVRQLVWPMQRSG